MPYNDFWFDFGSKVTGGRTSLIVDPSDGRIPPLTPEAEKRRKARAEARKGVGTDEISPDGWINELSAQVRCLVGFNAGPPFTPSAYNNNLQLIQTPDYVVIMMEMIHHARIVPLDGRPQLPAHMRHWLGSSRGRWEGNTLIVETTNRKDESFQSAGSDAPSHRAIHPEGCEHAGVRGHAQGPVDVDQPLDVRGPDGEERRRDLRVRLPRGQLLHGEHAPRHACPGESREVIASS